MLASEGYVTAHEGRRIMNFTRGGNSNTFISTRRLVQWVTYVTHAGHPAQAYRGKNRYPGTLHGRNRKRTNKGGDSYTSFIKKDFGLRGTYVCNTSFSIRIGFLYVCLDTLIALEDTLGDNCVLYGFQD